MRASIIIPAFNAEKTLAACLSACLAQETQDVEIIVVDDGSADSTAEIARGFSEVRVLSKLNAGPAAARNAGAGTAKGEFLAFTDADCIPRRDWLHRLLEGFDEGVVAVGGTYACANRAFRLARVVQAEIELRHRQYAGEVDFLGTFNVAYRAAAFRDAGGFNESYRQASGEDNDLAYRLQDAGGRLRFTAGAVVSHYHPDRLCPYLRTQARHGYWRVKLYLDHPNRAGGDQYAGLSDLLAPPLALLLLLFPLLLMAVGMAGGPVYQLLPVVATLITIYAVAHCYKILRIRSEVELFDLVYFAWMACLRDIARCAGMLRGIGQFRILGRRA